MGRGGADFTVVLGGEKSLNKEREKTDFMFSDSPGKKREYTGPTNALGLKKKRENIFSIPHKIRGTMKKKKGRTTIRWAWGKRGPERTRKGRFAYQGIQRRKGGECKIHGCAGKKGGRR